MKKILLFGILFIVGIALFVNSIMQTGLETIGESITTFSPWAFLLFLAVSLLNMIVFTYRWKILVDLEGRRISLFRLTLHSFAGFMLSYMTPATLLSGEPIKIYLLKKEHGIPVKEGSFSVITDKALEVTTFMIFIFISILLALSKGLIGREGLISIIVTVIITAVILGSFYWLTITKRGFFRTIFRLLGGHRIPRLQHLEQKIMQTEQRMFTFFMHHKRVFIITLLLAAASWSLRILEFMVVLYFLGIHLTFSEIFIVAFLPNISMLMPIPGGLGLLESATATILGLLGHSSSTAILLVLLMRIRDIVWVAIGLIHTSHHSIRSLFRSVNKLNPKESAD